MLSTFEFSGNTLGILIKSDIDDSVFLEMQEIINKKISEYGKINLFVEIEKGQQIQLVPLMKH